MRAIQIDRFGGPEVLHEVDLPIRDPNPGEVRIRHYACGINFTDVYARTGLYPNPLPVVLGVEGAGVVDAVGDGVTFLERGDRVAYAARTPGSYAKIRTLDATPVVKIPDAISFEQAAAMMLKGLTVEFLLRRTEPQGGLHPGDMILWHAVAGGVGQIACQWAKSLGLVLIGTAGSDYKCALARDLGATHTINYATEDVVARVREITGGHGVKVVYDSVGKDTWERSFDCLAPFGLLVLFGNASGPVPAIDPLLLSRKGSLFLTRPTLHTHLAERAVVEQMSAELFEMVTSGKVKIEIGQRYRIDDLVQAHRDLESRRTMGSSVMLP